MSSDHVPSEQEVDAIKQQLKLLGHSLPTEVIVRFLQENNELLTACQDPNYGASPSTRKSSAFKNNAARSASHTRGQPAKANPQELASHQPHSPAAKRSPQAAPELDVTWAAAHPENTVSNRITQKGSVRLASYGVHGQQAHAETAEGVAMRMDGRDQLLCTRDFMSNNTHSASHFNHGLRHLSSARRDQLKDSTTLEHDWQDLSSELDALAASLHRDSKPVTDFSQSRPEAQGHRQHRSDLAPGVHQQPLQQAPYASVGHREAVHEASLYNKYVQSMPCDTHGLPKTEECRPYSGDAEGDLLRQQDTAAESETESQHSGQQHGWKEGSACNSQRESSEYRGGARGSSRGVSASPGSVLGCPSLRSLPVLNNSFIVPAQAAKPKKVDRVTRYRELQQVWNKDAFLRSGGTAKTSKRRGENFNELYAACHAAEDKLKDLTLKHGRAVKGTAKSKAQQENVAPNEKRRDTVRWETRMRMQLRDDHY